jgi:carbonic anhydrase
VPLHVTAESVSVVANYRLAATIELHRISRVVALDHRDCGAARIAYGDEKSGTPQVETETHRAALIEFRKQLSGRHPKLAVETGLMMLGN